MAFIRQIISRPEFGIPTAAVLAGAAAASIPFAVGAGLVAALGYGIKKALQPAEAAVSQSPPLPVAAPRRYVPVSIPDPRYTVDRASLPASLEPKALSVCQRIVRFILGWLAKRILLPAAYFDIDPDAFARFETRMGNEYPLFTRSNHTITTPDGAELDVHLFRHPQAQADTPTTLYFDGNCSLKEDGGASWILGASQDKDVPMNLVLFNYRSVGNSKGTFNDPKDLLIDGFSILDWVEKSVGTPPDKIHFYGWSLGGAIALKTKALKPALSGKLLSDRSFSSAKNVLKAHLNWGRRLALWILEKLDFDLDAAADCAKLQGKKYFIYHPQDHIIPEEASIKNFAATEEILELHDPNGRHQNDHTEPHGSYGDAYQKISNFLFA